MTREIKFRAWDKRYNKMLIPPAINNPEIEDNEWVLMQFTGLKDKSGKEIYEGDILSGKNKNDGVVVGFKNGCFSMGNGFEVKNGLPHRRVIGNVFENKDLLTN